MGHFERVEWILFESKVSAKKLKDIIGVSKQTISDYRTGKKDVLKKMKYSTALKIENAFDEIKHEDEKCVVYWWDTETGEDRMPSHEEMKEVREANKPMNTQKSPFNKKGVVKMTTSKQAKWNK